MKTIILLLLAGFSLTANAQVVTEMKKNLLILIGFVTANTYVQMVEVQNFEPLRHANRKFQFKLIGE